MDGFLTRLRSNIVAFVAIILLIASAPVITLIIAIKCSLDSRPDLTYAQALTLGGPFVSGFWYMFVASRTRAVRAKLEYTDDRTGFLWALGRLHGGWCLSYGWVLAVLISMTLLWERIASTPSYIVYPSLSLAVWAPVLINLLRHFVRKPRLERELREDELRRQSAKKAAEQTKLAHQRELARERESITREYKELVERFAKLFSDGSSPWDESMRTIEVLEGYSIDDSFEDTVMDDAKRILATFALANGNAPNELERLGRLYCAVSCGEIETKNCILLIESTLLMEKVEYGRYKPIELPNAVIPLSAFDELRKTHLAADAAAAYASLIIRASECCSASMAVDMLRAKYMELLRPYISAEGFKNGNQSSSGYQNGNASSTQFNGNCAKCAKYFPVLRLKPDAGEKEAKSAFRDFAKIYHPDRFEGQSERQTAEEEFKAINEAFSHIAGHFVTSGRS